MGIVGIENLRVAERRRIKKFRIGNFRPVERFNRTLFIQNLAHLRACLHHHIIFV